MVASPEGAVIKFTPSSPFNLIRYIFIFAPADRNIRLIHLIDAFRLMDYATYIAQRGKCTARRRRRNKRWRPYRRTRLGFLLAVY